jgi:hypothetical protein
MYAQLSSSRPRRRGFARVGFAALLVASVIAASAGPAGADEPADPTAPTTTAPSTTVADQQAAIRAAIELPDLTERLEQTARRAAVARVNATTAGQQVGATDEAIAANNARSGAVRANLRKRAAEVYVRRGMEAAPDLEVEHAQDLSAGRYYGSLVGAVDQRQLEKLQGIAEALAAERDRRQAELDELTARQRELEAQRAQLEQQQARDQAALARVGGVPVMGDSVLTAAQLAAWYRSTGRSPKLAPGTTIDSLAQLYIEEGAAEHVRGDVAFAQSIVETASFSVAAGNNYSGIGVCDSCTGGYAFPTPRDGVRAQIQLLRSYADGGSRASNLAHPPSPALYGSDPARAAHLYDTFFLKGKVPLWNLMGNGNWATSKTYARSVLTTYSEMLAFSGVQAG